jgi:hypothetical protein
MTLRYLRAHFAGLQSPQVGKAAAAIPPYGIVLQVFEAEVLQKVVVQDLQVDRQIVMPKKVTRSNHYIYFS